mgnify:CR=1 FL=1
MNMNERFPGLAAPIQDMQSVRDRRRTGVLYYDVDLSTARTLAAGSALVLPFAGTILYIDQRENTGFAQVHLVDETFSAGNTPVTVFSGYILKAPFTQLVVENEAQPGRTLRILYGVDIDFIPGSGAGVTVTNPVNVLDEIDPICRSDVIAPGTAIGLTVTTVLAAALNVRGVRVRKMYQSNTAGAGGTITSWVVGASAPPAGIASLANSIILGVLANNTTNSIAADQPAMNRQIPVGWGIYIVSSINTAIAGGNGVHLSYEVL